MNDTILEVKNLSKFYGANRHSVAKMLYEGATKDEIFKNTGATVAINDVSFTVKKGGIFVLIGLSGSGKSTIVRCINMLQRPTAGTILFNDKNILAFNSSELRDYRRKHISMVFQSFGLMTHRNVLGNVVYGLEVKGIQKDERNSRAREIISMVGLEGWEDSPIDSLSGGMKQRVGIARALANNPDVLLMDEPFSALDPLVKSDMQFELLRIQRKLKKTIIFITHDINEAFKLGDMVGILRDGKMIQLDTPENMLSNPADEYVQKFITNVDRSKILTARNIMELPNCIIHARDGANKALNAMKTNSVSSAYIVGDNMELLGLITLDKALKVKSGEITMSEAIIRDLLKVNNIDMPVSELIPMAASAAFPIAIVDSSEALQGIVTKAAVLSSLS